MHPKECSRLYILDVSGYIFRAYFAIPPMSSPNGEPTHALFGFIRSVIKLLKEENPGNIVAVFDGPDNKKQRLEIYEKYKMNRVRSYDDLPDQIDKAKQFCELIGIPHLEVGGVEADDTIGSVAVWAAKQKIDVYICTSDKDLCQLVNDHIFVVNPWKENLLLDRAKVEEVYGVKPEQIVDLLAIMGDSSDNIPGLSGFGPKTAVPLLQEFGSLEYLLKHPEKVKGKKKQETLVAEAEIARLSQRLATIYTDVEFHKDPHFFALKKLDLLGLKEFYLEMGFSSLVKDLEEAIRWQAPKEKTEYHTVNDEKSLNDLVALLEEHEEVSFDVETTDIRPLRADLVGIGFCVQPGVAYYVPLNGNLSRNTILSKLRHVFENPNIGFYGHNVKYDLHVLANLGIRVARITFDTILASYLLNSGTRRHSLDILSLQYFGKVKISIKTLLGVGKKEMTMDQVPIEKVAEYCCEDVDYTLRLKQLLHPEIIKRKLESLLFDLELPLSLLLAKMERAGVYIDVSKLNELAVEVKKDLLACEKEIYTLAGEEFNIASPKQLSKILFEKLGIKPLKKTATGHSTRADVLENLSLDYPIAKSILEYRVLDKLRSTYIETLPHDVNPNTQRIHPTFSQFIAATGRLACQDPNLQNIPVRTPQGKRIREAFHPQKRGWSYLSADYSQIELRLLAHLSEDPALLTAFNHGEDIHAYTASLIFAIPLHEVSPVQRDQAKAINFGIIYGQQAYGLSQELGIDVREAAEFIEAYFQRYPKVFNFIEKCIEETRKSGRSITMIGREREIPEIHSSNMVARNAAERLAINTPLQGSAADLIKLAMLEIETQLVKKNLHSFLVLQIHDELIFEAPDEELPELQSLVKKAMEGVFSLKVPLVVDIHIGKNWAEC